MTRPDSPLPKSRRFARIWKQNPYLFGLPSHRLQTSATIALLRRRGYCLDAWLQAVAFLVLCLRAGERGDPRLGEPSRAGRGSRLFDEGESLHSRDRLAPNMANTGPMFGPRLVLLAERPDPSAARISPAYLCAIDWRSADSGNTVARRRRRS